MTQIQQIVPVSRRETQHTIIVTDATGQEHVICKDRPDWAKLRSQQEGHGDGQHQHTDS